MKSFRGRWWLW